MTSPLPEDEAETDVDVKEESAVDESDVDACSDVVDGAAEKVDVC